MLLRKVHAHQMVQLFEICECLFEVLESLSVALTLAAQLQIGETLRELLVLSISQKIARVSSEEVSILEFCESQAVGV